MLIHDCQYTDAEYPNHLGWGHCPLSDALSFAHSHDVIHRDIKPENILFEAGHAVVSDFGIARAINAAGSDRLTETGLAVGTPSYMSPEQAAGSRELDGRSDLYSLACVVYEMLAGEPPFTGPTVESVVRQHLTAAAPPVTTVRPGTPPGVALALERALAKTPADRHPTAAAFAEALAAPTPVATLAPAGATAPGLGRVLALYLTASGAVLALVFGAMLSLGLPAVFLWGGKRRADAVRRLRLESGDIAVWGGPARFVYHGVAPLKDGQHPLTGAARINLTFRKVF